MRQLPPETQSDLIMRPFDRQPVRSYLDDNRILTAKFSQWLEIQNYLRNTRRAYADLIHNSRRASWRIRR